MATKRSGIWRTKLLEVISQHCVRSHYGYPIAWNVKMHKAVPSFDIVFNRMLDENYASRTRGLLELPRIWTQYRDRWDEWVETAYPVCLEDMQGQFVGRNKADTWMSVRPQLVKKYRLSKEMWDVEYEFTGRQGGYLGLDRFEGERICGADIDDLPIEIVRPLSAFVEEIGDAVMNRYDEMEYQLSWRLHDDICDELTMWGVNNARG